MTQPTTPDLFDNGSTLISSAAYDTPSKTLTIVFSANVSALQAYGAIVQSGHKWLLANTDVAVNASASAASTNSTTRNNVSKEMTSLSVQFYTPLPAIEIDPLQL